MQYFEFAVDWDIDKSQFFRQRKLWIPGAWNHPPFPAQLGVHKNSGQNKWRLCLWLGNDRIESGKEAKFNGFWRRIASNECCHARSTMVTARLEMVGLIWLPIPAPRIWRQILPSVINDCWGWPAQWWRGRQLWTWRCRLIFCKCLQTSTVVSCCWQVYWNGEISWVTVFPCYDQCLNCIKKSVLRNRVEKTCQIVIQKLHMNFFGNLTKCRMNCVPNLRNTLLPQLMGPNFTEYGV